MRPQIFDSTPLVLGDAFSCLTTRGMARPGRISLVFSPEQRLHFTSGWWCLPSTCDYNCATLTNGKQPSGVQVDDLHSAAVNGPATRSIGPGTVLRTPQIRPTSQSLLRIKRDKTLLFSIRIKFLGSIKVDSVKHAFVE